MAAETVEFGRMRAAPDAIAAYRKAGQWQSGTIIDDLWRAAQACPQRVAIDAHEAAGSVTKISYAVLAALVDRWAEALHHLGLSVGDAVAYQLPNCWQAAVLHLACLRAGVIAVPLGRLSGHRNVELILRSTRAALMVIRDEWEGVVRDCPLADAADRLPELRYRVVLGDATRTGALDFTACFPLDGPDIGGVKELPTPDPDRAFTVVFTSGTTGEPKGVVHTANTLYADCAGRATLMASEAGNPNRGVAFTPYTLGHTSGLVVGLWTPILLNWTTVLRDLWEPAAVLDLMAATGVHHFSSSPANVSALLDEQRRHPRELSLTAVNCGATSIPAHLSENVGQYFGARLFAAWGMTEVPGGTVTRIEDPEHWATRSDGRPRPGIRLRLVPDEYCPAPAGRLHVSGPSVCLATFARDTRHLLWRRQDTGGWYDTGDYARPDGRDGIRIIGRVPDRVLARNFAMLPVREIEDAIRTHTGVRDVALIGYPDPVHGELPCAVIELHHDATPPACEDLCAHLTRLGFSEYMQPACVQLIDTLPRNSMGKILRRELRRRYASD